MPGVLDLWSYGETGYHSLAGAVVRERYRREAMVSAFRILGEGQLSLTKFLLATDRAVDLRDFEATLRHVLERADFRTDLFVLSNVSMDSLDYAGPRLNEGSKGVLLGLGEKRRELPTEFTGSPREARGRGARLHRRRALRGRPRSRTTRTPPRAWPPTPPSPTGRWSSSSTTPPAARSAMNFLWTTFTRFDPARDMHARSVDLVHHHPSFTPPIVIDARMKPSYPVELFCDPDTAATVDRRWKEYFPDGGVEMGDSSLGHLTPTR